MRVFLVALVVAVAVAASAAELPDSPREAATALARRAARAEKKKQDAQAYLYYAEAAALQPRNRKYAGKMEALRTRATRQSPPVVPKGAAELLPEHPVVEPFDNLTEREMAQARALKDLPTLRGKAGLESFDLTGGMRNLFDKITAAFGLDVVYDGDYPQNDPPIHFKIDPSTYRQALEYLQAATSSFIIPISSRVMMVAKDTQQKRTELEQTISISVPLPAVSTTQELTEIAQVVRQATNVEKIAWDTAQGRIVIRDRVSRVVPAVALLDQLLSYRPEVIIDVEFLQVSASDVKNYGFQVTDTVPAHYLGQVLRSVASPAGVAHLLVFGGGKTLIGLGVAEAQAMFNETISTSRSLYRAQIRSVAGQNSTLHVGEKYPVMTGGFIGRVDPSQGTVFQPPPSFTFEDLGFSLKVTPYIHGMGEVTLTLETSFQVLTGQTVNDVPIIGRRAMNAQVRVQDGEWAVLGGIMAMTKSRATSGVAGLSQIPLLGHLFRKVSTNDEDSSVLIGIRPRLMALPPDQIVTQRLRVGSDVRPYTPF